MGSSSATRRSIGKNVRMRGSGKLVAIAAVGFVLLVAMVVLAIELPIAALAAFLLVVAALVGLRFGVLATVTAACILLLGLSGALALYLPITEPLTQVGVLALIGLGFIGIFRVRVPLAVSIPTVVYVIVATIAAVPALQQSLEFGLRGWVSLVTPVFAALAVASATRPGRKTGTRQRDLVFGTIVAVALLNSFWALRQALFGMTFQEIRAAELGESTFAVGDQIRLMGTFATNQDFGLFTACLAPALLVVGIATKRYRRLLLVASGLIYLVILLSLTRTALVASVAVGILALIAWGRGPLVGRMVRLTAVVAVLVGLGVAVLSQVDNVRIQESLARASTLFDLTGDTSFVARWSQTLPRGFAAFNYNPWGSGAGAAGPVSGQFPTLAPLGPVTTDNGYLLIAIQAGLFGVIAFVAMLLATAIWLARRSSMFARAGAAAVGALMVAMLLAGYWGLLAPISIVAAIVGLGIGDASREKPADDQTGAEATADSERRRVGSRARVRASR